MNTSIEDKIKEISLYFRNKMIVGDYEFIRCNDHRATIKVDKYEFDLWIANVIEVDLSIYPANSIITNDIIFRGAEDRLKIWDSLEPYVKSYRKKKKIEELRELIDKIEELEEVRDKIGGLEELVDKIEELEEINYEKKKV